MSQKKYHHGDLRNALIQAALTLLREAGIEALSLRAVAAAAGVSHMAPYSHFKNKKALLQSIAAWGFRELALRMERDAKQETAPEQLVLAYGTTYVTFALENPQLYRLMLGQADTVGKRVVDKVSVAKISADDPVEQVTPERSQVSDLEHCAQRPFALLQAAFARRISAPEQVRIQALGAWSLVHGTAALLIEGHYEIPAGMSVRDFLWQAAIRTPQ